MDLREIWWECVDWVCVADPVAGFCERGSETLGSIKYRI
jgi:hypothetical protein